MNFASLDTTLQCSVANLRFLIKIHRLFVVKTSYITFFYRQQDVLSGILPLSCLTVPFQPSHTKPLHQLWQGTEVLTFPSRSSKTAPLSFRSPAGCRPAPRGCPRPEERCGTGVVREMRIGTFKHIRCIDEYRMFEMLQSHYSQFNIRLIICFRTKYEMITKFALIRL